MYFVNQFFNTQLKQTNKMRAFTRFQSSFRCVYVLSKRQKYNICWVKWREWQLSFESFSSLRSNEEKSGLELWLLSKRNFASNWISVSIISSNKFFLSNIFRAQHNSWSCCQSLVFAHNNLDRVYLCLS